MSTERKRIYADNAATTRLSETAYRAMLPYLAGDCFANPSGLYSEAMTAREALFTARKRIAACIGAHSDEIIFTSGGTEADNMAIYFAAVIGEKWGKRHILASPIEHHAVLNALERLSERGFEVEYLPVTPTGYVESDAVWNALRDDTCFVTVMTANNEIGTIQPIRNIGEICRERGVLFHTDAVQAVGHIAVDAGKDGFSLLSASGHKFHAPRGIGFLYVRDGIFDGDFPALTVGGGQERGRRAGTENVAGAVGMSAALEEMTANMAENAQHVGRLTERLIGEVLLRIPDVILNGSMTNRLPSNANFYIEGVSGDTLVCLLDNAGIVASAGSACTSGNLKGSHVLKAIGMDDRAATQAIRLTLGEDTTDEDVDAIVDALAEAVARVRKWM